MASGQNGDSGTGNEEADFAQAFKELARGERAAAAMENHLDSLEKKIEDLLAKADEDEQRMKAQSKEASDKQTTSNDESKEVA